MLALALASSTKALNSHAQRPIVTGRMAFGAIIVHLQPTMCTRPRRQRVGSPFDSRNRTLSTNQSTTSSGVLQEKR